MNPFAPSDRSEGHSRRLQRQKTDIDLNKKAGAVSQLPQQKVLGKRIV